jgi:putative hydrolase of the HAD superfamily
MLGVDREGLAIELAEAYRTCWPDHCRAYDDAVPMLRSLGDRYVVAVITNGPTDVQRAKLRHSGLDVFFPTVVISGECGFAKPHQRAFAAALAGLGTTGRDTVMIGDHAERDVAGARQAGMDAIWLNRHAATRPEGLDGVVEIGSLSDLRSALLDL